MLKWGDVGRSLRWARKYSDSASSQLTYLGILVWKGRIKVAFLDNCKGRTKGESN